jgi:integrase family protein with SAM-like domain
MNDAARTVDPAVESFLALAAARLAPRTVEAYRRDLEHFRSWRDGGGVNDASVEELQRYVAHLRAEGRSASTIARRTAALRAFFKHQTLVGARGDNPAAELDLPRRRRKLPRTLSSTQRPERRRARCAIAPSSSSCTEPAYGSAKPSASNARGSICRNGSCAAPAKAGRSGSCRSAARPSMHCAATSRVGGRSSTSGTGLSSS